MTDDAQRARDELAAEAARLAAKRQADADAKVRTQQTAVADQNHERVAGQNARLRGALFKTMFLGLGATFLAAAALTLFLGSLPPEDSDEVGVLTREEAALGVGFAIVGAAIISMRFTAIGRSRRWRARLPFAVEHYELTLGLDRYVSVLSIAVRFRETPIAKVMLAELVTARLPEAEVHEWGDALEIRSPRLDTEGANWRPANWFHKLVRSVLLDVHRGYPIASVTVNANETTEFYVPSGD